MRIRYNYIKYKAYPIIIQLNYLIVLNTILIYMKKLINYRKLFSTLIINHTIYKIIYIYIYIYAYEIVLRNYFLKLCAGFLIPKEKILLVVCKVALRTIILRDNIIRTNWWKINNITYMLQLWYNKSNMAIKNIFTYWC